MSGDLLVFFISLSKYHHSLTEILRKWQVAFPRSCVNSKLVLDLEFEYHRRLLHKDPSDRIAMKKSIAILDNRQKMSSFS